MLRTVLVTGGIFHGTKVWWHDHFLEHDTFQTNLALTSQGPAEGGSDVTAGRLKMPGKGTPPTPCPLRPADCVPLLKVWKGFGSFSSSKGTYPVTANLGTAQILWPTKDSSLNLSACTAPWIPVCSSPAHSEQLWVVNSPGGVRSAYEYDPTSQQGHCVLDL